MNENPKAIEGDKKTPLHLLPPVALEQIAWAHKAGADIYQPFNWRTQPIRMTTYVAALLRHTLAWAGGEDIDPKSGLSHLAHVGANANILLDAAHCGTLVDDRPKVPDQTGRFRGVLVNPDYKEAEDFAVPTGMNGVQPQYRMLEAGETIQAGDEVMTPEKENIRPRWIPAYGHFLSQQVFSFNVGCIRRPLP